MIREATPLEMEQFEVASHAVWGAPVLTLAQYQAREAVFQGTAYGRSPHRRIYVYQVDESGPVMGMCEVYWRALWSEPKKVKVNLYSISTVLTMPVARKKGIATKLLAEIETCFEGPWVSLLFSEVDPHIYEKSGYKTLLSQERHWVTASSGKALKDFETVEISEREADKLMPIFRPRLDVVRLRQVLEWHRARESFYAKVLGMKKPIARGVRSLEDLTCAVIWYVDYRVHCLRVLASSSAFRPDDETHAPSREVLARLSEEASALQLNGLYLWNRKTRLLDPGELIEGVRMDAIAMVKTSPEYSERFLARLEADFGIERLEFVY